MIQMYQGTDFSGFCWRLSLRNGTPLLALSRDGYACLRAPSRELGNFECWDEGRMFSWKEKDVSPLSKIDLVKEAIYFACTLATNPRARIRIQQVSEPRKKTLRR